MRKRPSKFYTWMINDAQTTQTPIILLLINVGDAVPRTDVFSNRFTSFR